MESVARIKMDMPDQGISITAGTIMKSRTGEKIGWTAGWSGGFIWVVILSIIFLIQNNWSQGLSGLLLVGLAVLSIVFSAPWRYPSTPYWKLMVPNYMVLFGALVWGICVYGGTVDSGLNWWSLFLLLPLLIPVMSMGKQTWNDLNRQANISVQDTRTER
jgi:phosphatidylserine synthase